jgi:methyltransferase (TIGR00027 family)
VRTRFLDNWLERPHWPPVRTTRRQVCLLGAGMDTRAYRLGLGSSTTIFEVEDADLLELKHAVLAKAGHRPRSRVIPCAADTQDPQVRIAPACASPPYQSHMH